jgi:5-oxoprolinase (ATP-hydrolysing) subunit A
MDINCDLGEGESLAKTHRLLQWVTSANIACGGHAGNERTMRACLKLCRQLGVNAGAHPGFEDRQNFGRRAEPIAVQKLTALIESQTARLAALAEAENLRLAHIKLHGALYHVVEQDKRLARGYVALVIERFAGFRIIASPQGEVVRAARRRGIDVWGELFSDRAYAKDGTLVPRGRPGAIVEDIAEIRRRMEMFRAKGCILAANGEPVAVAARTVCVHADSPSALRIARMLAKLFRDITAPSGRSRTPFPQRASTL